MNTLTSASKATCLDGGKVHSWAKCGQDIHRGRWVWLRKCVWCTSVRRLAVENDF